MGTRAQLFKRIDNALFDMQASTQQNFEQHFQTFARLLADPSLQPLNGKLIANLDVEHFLSDSAKTQGSMVGSARLVWPADSDEVLGLTWLLIQNFAREPRKILSFAHTFYTVGRNVNGELHSLTRQLLIPFARDYKDFVMREEQPDGVGSDVIANTGEVQGSTHNITYIISGNNARVNNQSTDNSVNTISLNSEVSNHLQALRDEIQLAPLTTDQKSEAIEMVDAVEAEIASGNAKKGVVRTLITGLPAIASITTIGKNLFDLLKF